MGVGEIVELNVWGGDEVNVGVTVTDGVFVIRIVDVCVTFGEDIGTGFAILLQDDINKIKIEEIENIM